MKEGEWLISFAFPHFIQLEKPSKTARKPQLHMRPFFHCWLRSLHNIINRDHGMMHGLISRKKSLTQLRGIVRQYSPTKNVYDPILSSQHDTVYRKGGKAEKENNLAPDDFWEDRIQHFLR